MLVAYPVREVISTPDELSHRLLPEFRLYAEAIRALAASVPPSIATVTGDHVCVLTSHYLFEQGGLYIHDFTQPEAFEGTWELDLLEAVSLRQAIIEWKEELSTQTSWSTHDLMRRAFLVNNDGFLSLRLPMEMFLCASLTARVLLVSAQPVLHIRCHQKRDRVSRFLHSEVRVLQLQPDPPCMGFPGLIAKRLSQDLTPCAPGKVVNYYQLCHDAWAFMNEFFEGSTNKDDNQALVDLVGNRLLQAFRAYPPQPCTPSTMDSDSLLYVQEATSLPAGGGGYWHVGSALLEVACMKARGPNFIDFYPWRADTDTDGNTWARVHAWNEDCTITKAWVAPEVAGGGPLKMHPRFMQLYPVHQCQLEKPVLQPFDVHSACSEDVPVSWHLDRTEGDDRSVHYLVSSRLMLSCQLRSSQDDTMLVATHPQLRPRWECTLPATLSVISMLQYVLMHMLQADEPAEYTVYADTLYHVIRGNTFQPNEDDVLQDCGGTRAHHTLVALSEKLFLVIDLEGVVTLYMVGYGYLRVRVRGPGVLQGRVCLLTKNESSAIVYTYDSIQSCPESDRTVGSQLKTLFMHWVIQEHQTLPRKAVRVVERLSERLGAIMKPCGTSTTPLFQNPCWALWNRRLFVGESMFVRSLCTMLRDDNVYFICDDMAGLMAKNIMLQRDAAGLYGLFHNGVRLNELRLAQPAVETRNIPIADVTTQSPVPTCCIVFPRRSVRLHLLPSSSTAVSFWAIHTGGDVVKEAIITIGNSASTGAAVVPVEDEKQPLLPTAAARRGGGGKASAPSESTRPAMPVLVAAEEQLDTAAWKDVPATPKKILQLSDNEETRHHQLALAASVIAAYLAQQDGGAQQGGLAQQDGIAQQGGTPEHQGDRELEDPRESVVSAAVPELCPEDIITGTAHTGLRRRRHSDESSGGGAPATHTASAASDAFDQLLRASCRAGADGPELHPVPVCFAEFQSTPNDTQKLHTHLKNCGNQQVKLRAKSLTATRFWYMYKFVSGSTYWWLMIPRIPSQNCIPALDTASAFYDTTFTYQLGKVSVCTQWEHDESDVLESCGKGLHYCFKWSACTAYVSAPLSLKSSDRVFVFDLEPDGQWRIHEQLFFNL